MKYAWLMATLVALNIPAAFADVHRYKIPERGAIVLDVPAGWHEEVRFVENAKRPLIVKFSPPAGTGFRVNVAPMWNPNQLAPNLTPAEVRAGVRDEADRAKRQAAEPEIKVVDFTAGKAFGSYFSATAKGAKDGYKHLTQGAMALDDLIVHFDVYSNEARDDVVARTIEMMKAARRER